jgi:hypothetical protein
MSSSSTTRRRAPVPRWLIVPAAVVSIGVMGYVVYRDYAIERERTIEATNAVRDREAAEAEAAAGNPAWRLEQLEAARQQLPDEQNAAVIVRRLAKTLPGSVFGWNMNRKERLLVNLPPQDRLGEEQLLVLRDAVAPLAPERGDALRLKNLPDGRFAVQYAFDFLGTEPTEALSSRVVRQFLFYDAMLRAEENDAAGAVAACHALLNAARSVGDEPLILSQLERLAGQELTVLALERVLAQVTPPAAALQQLHEALVREGNEQPLAHALRGARGGVPRVYRAFEDEGGPPPHRDYAAQLRYLTRAVEVSQRPVEQQRAALAELEASKSKLPALARQLVPALEQVFEVNVRAQAQLRCAVVAVAAERYRLMHQSWPASAAELLRSGLLASMPVDPFDGQPLRWRLLPDGLVVYSVGYDRVDNGGLPVRGDSGAEGSDIVFRLWHAPARRQAVPRC